MFATDGFDSYVFFFQAEDGIRDWSVTGVQTCALPIWRRRGHDARQREPGAAEERAVLGGGTLVAAGQHQHVQVGEEHALGVDARVDALRNDSRSEERRVGKECRSWRSAKY